MKVLTRKRFEEAGQYIFQQKHLKTDYESMPCINLKSMDLTSRFDDFNFFVKKFFAS